MHVRAGLALAAPMVIGTLFALGCGGDKERGASMSGADPDEAREGMDDNAIAASRDAGMNGAAFGNAQQPAAPAMDGDPLGGDDETVTEGERCDDGIDDDGDSAVDEGCPCAGDATQACFGGPPERDGVGLCARGEQRCLVEREFPTWGECTDFIDAVDEVCNALDDDCDGAVDETCECIAGNERACYGGSEATRGVGPCADGTQVCGDDGTWGPCEGDQQPEDESCDGLDNDCDGTVDGLLRPCYSGADGTEDVGPCHGGVSACADGEWGGCFMEVTPEEEICDGVDNDCDGTVDGLADRACYSGDPATLDVGPCRGGTQSCVDGAWAACMDEVLPAVEQCDDIDNDCDGTVDGITRACYTGPDGTEDVGLCQGGTETCTTGAWGSCDGEVTPVAEVCDGEDNDCNDAVDELSECDPPPPPPGTDIVVFNDINIFDEGGMASADNVQMVQNLVGYTHAGPRGSVTTVWMDYGRASVCGGGVCSASAMPTLYSTITNAGYTVVDNQGYSSIAADVKVVFLWNPTIDFTLDEINMYKAFAAEGGRVIFVGEHASYYGAGIPIENAFLLNMGAVMTNTGGMLDCGSHRDQPAASMRPHQITTGMVSVRMACASVIVPGPNDYPLYYDATNTDVLAGVATIDTTPSTELIPLP